MVEQENIIVMQDIYEEKR